MAFIGADYNRRSWIYKITRFSYWIMVVVEGMEGGGWCKVSNVRVGVTKIEQVRTRGEGNRVQTLVILWERNNWMTSSGLFKMKIKMKNRSYRYDMNGPRSRHGHKYSKYQKCLSMMLLICIKQHLTNIWSSIHEKVKQHSGWVEKKRYLYEKRV